MDEIERGGWGALAAGAVAKVPEGQRALRMEEASVNAYAMAQQDGHNRKVMGPYHRLLLLWGLFLVGGFGWTAPPAPRVIWLVAPCAGWATSNPQDWPAQAAWAGLSDPALRLGRATTLLAIGMGGRAPQLTAGEPPASGGLQATPDGHWRVPDTRWRQVCRAATAAYANAQPGGLGALLRRHQIPSLLIAPSSWAEAGALLVADENGQVARWSPALDSVAPAALAGTVLVIVAPTAASARAAELRAAYPTTPLLYLGLPSAAERRAHPDFAPVAVWGWGPGVLMSARTHRTGIVSALDLVPTLLALAQAPPPTVALSPLHVSAVPHALRAMTDLAARARGTFWARRWVPGIWGTLLGLLWSLSLLCPALRTPPVVRCALTGWIIAGLFVIGLPAGWQWPVPLQVAGMLGCWGALMAMAAQVPLRTLWGLAAWCGAALLLVDLFDGGRLTPMPLLGFDPLAGHRFFGMGNEAMGVLLILLTMGCAWLIDRWPAWRRVSLLTLYGGVALGLGIPWWGANWGGAMTAVALGALFGLRLPAGRPHPGRLLGAVGGGLLWGGGLIGVLTALNARWSTHIGTFGQTVVDHGSVALWQTIGRKLLFAWENWVTYSGGAIVLCTLVLGASIWSLRARATHAGWQTLWEGIWVGWWGGWIAALLNDSGVPLAALMWGTLTPATLILLSLPPVACRPSQGVLQCDPASDGASAGE
jgi:hypothetical protein